jgi:hypothetical protein
MAVTVPGAGSVFDSPLADPSYFDGDGRPAVSEGRQKAGIYHLALQAVARERCECGVILPVSDPRKNERINGVIPFKGVNSDLNRARVLHALRAKTRPQMR